MATRKAAKATEPEEVEETEEETEEEKDYTAYADKEPTATMVDFADWLLEEVYGGKFPGDESDFREGVRLGGTLRMEFQRSEFNVARREERKASRVVAEEPEEAEEKPAKGTRTGRPAKPVAATTRPASGKPTASAAKARRGGKPAAAEAPF